VKIKRDEASKLSEELNGEAKPQSSGKLVPVTGDLSIKVVEVAIDAANGNISKAAKYLGVRRHVLARFVAGNFELKMLVDDYIEEAKDNAEELIRTAVNEGDFAAGVRLLETHGKERGKSVDGYSGQTSHLERALKSQRT
jgi:hypothetical protein